MIDNSTQSAPSPNTRIYIVTSGEEYVGYYIHAAFDTEESAKNFVQHQRAEIDARYQIQKVFLNAGDVIPSEMRHCAPTPEVVKQ